MLPKSIIRIREHIVGALAVNVNQILYPPSFADHLLDYLNLLVGQHRISAKRTAAPLPLPYRFILAVGFLLVTAMLKLREIILVQIRIETDLAGLVLNDGEGSQPNHPASGVIRQCENVIPSHINPKFPQYGFPVPA